MIAFNFQTSLILNKLKHWEVKLLIPATLFIRFLPYTGLRKEKPLCSTVLHTLGQNNLRNTVLRTSVAHRIKLDRVTNSVSTYA